MCVNIYNLYIYSNYYQRITFSIESSDFKIYEHVLQCALDYLREGFPWSARPFKHTESNSFRHTVTTFICQYKYTNWCFILVTTSWASRSGPPSTGVDPWYTKLDPLVKDFKGALIWSLCDSIYGFS